MRAVGKLICAIGAGPPWATIRCDGCDTIGIMIVATSRTEAGETERAYCGTRCATGHGWPWLRPDSGGGGRGAMKRCPICGAAFDSPYPKKTCSPACASVSRKNSVTAKKSPGAPRTVAVDHGRLGVAPIRTAETAACVVERGTFPAAGFSMLGRRI